MAYKYVKPSTVNTPVSGATAPASWGTSLNNALDVLAPLSAIIRRAAVQSVGDSTDNIISFDTEDIDDNGFFTTDNPTQITFMKTGLYLLDVQVAFSADADGYRTVKLLRSGGSADITVNCPAINGAAATVNFPFLTGERDTTDYYEVNVFHTAGNALDVTARIGVTLVQERST